MEAPVDRDKSSKGQLYRYCSKDLAIAANKRADMLLRGKLASISSEREHCVRVYKLHRLQVTKELLAMEKSSAQCRKDNFKPSNYPCIWEGETQPRFREARQSSRRVHLPAVPQGPQLLYGEEPSTFLTERARTVSLSDVSVSLSELEKDPILEDLRKIKSEACARKPRKPEVKAIAVNRFVNEFEWLDTKHTTWFMEKTIKIFHENLMREMQRKRNTEKELYFRLIKKKTSKSKFVVGPP